MGATREARSWRCLPALFEQQVERTPDETAIVRGDTRWSYRDLNRRANQIAHHLRARGVTPDTLVPVCLRRRPELVAALLGIWKSGAAFVPLDPAYPADRLAFMLTDSGAPLVLASAGTAARLGSPDAPVISLDADAAALDRERDDNPTHVNEPSHLAYVMYTSGSTGKPKGVMVEHRGLENYLVWAIGAYDVRAGGAVPVHGSIAFDLTLTSLFPALLVGASIDLLPDDGDVPQLVDALRSARRRSLLKITPIANTELYVLDDKLRPVPAGMTGELYVGGAGVARGYLNRPALTVERFVDDPFSGRPGARLYRTGDLARQRPDGLLEFFGRMDAQVKIRGFRIELGEIEATLAGHDAVQTSAAIVREDTPGDRYLAAYVVARSGISISIESSGLLEHLRQRLPEYMIPRYVCLLDRLPLTTNGKIDRAALPSPVPARRAPARNAMPRTESEHLVLKIFHEALGQPDLGVFDNFFEAGGHSLSAARLLSNLRDVSNINLPLRSLFECPTPAGLAALLDGVAYLRSADPSTPPAAAWDEVEV